MLTKEQKEEVEYVRDCVLAKFPLLGITMSQLKTIADVREKTRSFVLAMARSVVTSICILVRWL